tara:strand:- start:728 stop:1165 length:438 start_codon:yes stop_codon:yes gene_type:complete
VNVTIATSIKHGNYKHLQDRANRLVHFVGIWEAKLKQYINYHPDVELSICPIRKAEITGQANLGANKIEIDPRYTLRQQCKTIIHELIHNEQVNQHRLEVGIRWKWDNVFYENDSDTEKYTTLPWEVEARTRTKEIFSDIFGSLN